MSSPLTQTTDYKHLITEQINAQDFVRATFSGQQRGQAVPWERVVLRPVLLKDTRHMQFSFFDSAKDITKNYTGATVAEQLDQVLALGFKHYVVLTEREQLQITLSRKGKPLVSRTRNKQPIDANLQHNRAKNTILSPDEAAPFLQAVGIMAADGRIKNGMYSKFRQINEFLRFIDQTGALQHGRTEPLHVVDFGCGNAYLTFATCHYLANVLGIPTHLTGVDLKADLLTKHAETSRALGWDSMAFENTRIIDYQPDTPPELVIALHACDTATDEALAQALGWQSRLIFSAPCCQHHLQVQLDQQPTPAPFRPVARHGILKERLGDILTDTFRALVLRILGYQTDVVQFVSDEHTARNVLIRAVRAVPPGDAKFIAEYRDLKAFWGVTPYLEELLGEEFAEMLAA